MTKLLYSPEQVNEKTTEEQQQTSKGNSSKITDYKPINS